MIYLTLFWEFAKIGLFAFGGGPITLPFVYSLADQYAWFTYADFADMVAVAQSAPGALGANMATYAGFHAAGLLGGLAANLGLIFPSLIIVLLVARFLSTLHDNKYVQWIFYGLRAAVVGLTAAIALGLIQTALFITGIEGDWPAQLDIKALLLFAVLLPAVFIFKKHPAIYISAAAIIGIIGKF